MKKRQKIPFIDKVFLGINAVLCLALLLSYFAPFTNPKTMWVIAFFGLAYPPLLLANLLMAVYWGLRRSRFMLISIVVILCGYNVLFNNIGFRLGSQTAKPANAGALRVLTYNVHDFRNMKDPKDKTSKHQFLDIIGDQQPDILCVQEFFTRNRGKFAMTDSLKKAINVSEYYYGRFLGTDKDGMGMAVFSRYPIVAKGMIQLTEALDNGNQCLFIDVKRNGRLLRVYNVHLQSIKFEPVDYRYIDTVTKSGKTDYMATRRLGAKLKKAFIKRSEQVAKIKGHMQQCPYPYILAGDFNDTPSSFAVNQMAKGIKNAFREKGSGLGRTYNGDFPNYQIDYVMASNDFDIAGYRIIEKKLSDHYPVCVDMVLK